MTCTPYRIHKTYRQSELYICISQACLHKSVHLWEFGMCVCVSQCMQNPNIIVKNKEVYVALYHEPRKMKRKAMLAARLLIASQIRYGYRCCLNYSTATNMSVIHNILPIFLVIMIPMAVDSTQQKPNAPKRAFPLSYFISMSGAFALLRCY